MPISFSPKIGLEMPAPLRNRKGSNLILQFDIILTAAKTEDLQVCVLVLHYSKVSGSYS